MRFMQHYRLRLGFTLIELLVVIAIIGILGSIASVYMGSPRAKAEDVQTLATMRQVASAIEQEQAASLSASYLIASGANDDASWTLLLAALPSDQAAQLPPAGNGYAVESAAAGYCLWKVSRQDDTKTIYCETGARCSDKEGVDTATALPAGCAHPAP